MEIGKRSTDYASIWQMREIFAQHIRQFHVNNQYMPRQGFLDANVHAARSAPKK